MSVPATMPIAIGAATPVAVYNALHRHFARQVMETASWDTTSEDDAKRKRYQLARRALEAFLDTPIPVDGIVSVADWILDQLGRLSVGGIATPDDSVRLWRALRLLLKRRRSVSAEYGPCWQIPFELPPR